MIHQPLRKTRLKAAAVASVSAICVLAGSTSAIAAAAEPNGDGYHKRHHRHYEESQGYNHFKRLIRLPVGIKTQVVTNTSGAPQTLKSGDELSAKATCPTGSIITGGGYSVTSSNKPQFFSVIQNSPSGVNPPTDWDVTVTAQDAPTGVVVTAYAVCVQENAFPKKKSYWDE